MKLDIPIFRRFCTIYLKLINGEPDDFGTEHISLSNIKPFQTLPKPHQRK